MQKFRMHVVSLPHTQTTKEYLPCAYTQKVINFCKMMKDLGHEVYLYASEDNDAPCDELITCITKAEQETFFGATDWKKAFFPIDWDESLPYWQLMNGRVITEVSKRKKMEAIVNKEGKEIQVTKDFLCIIGGSCQAPILEGLKDMIAVEFGIGYRGICAEHRVWESYAWMHHVYGLNQVHNGVNFDAVIPNYFDARDFPDVQKPENYYAFVGRLIGRKGAHIAAEACGIAGSRLIMAGQGVKEKNGSEIIAEEVTINNPLVQHIGTINAQQRGDLMGKAIATFVPTQYIEPFGGVHIESMLCGTPVITSDWGVFTETVTNGFNGFRCRNMGEYIWAMKECAKFTPEHRAKIREWALKNFTLDRVKWQYQAFFEQVYTRWEHGWYSTWDKGISEYNRYNDFRTI